jgi:hypothetical protein
MNVTIGSTISLINKSLVEFESVLKQLLPGLIEVYNLLLTYPTGETINSENYPVIVEALRSIALAGFTGLEKDNYYIIQLLLEGKYGSIRSLIKIKGNKMTHMSKN